MGPARSFFTTPEWELQAPGLTPLQVEHSEWVSAQYVFSVLFLLIANKDSFN